MFPQPDTKTIAQREDDVTKFWKKNKIFQKSVEQRSKDDFYSFLDGPPFVTGMPHYAQLLARIAKDVIPRYQTMKGKRVRRVWGWDCHGLPIEEKVEEKIGLKNRRDIEKYGVHEFIDQCRLYVNEISSAWEWYVDKIGHWVDFEHSYKTMNIQYMESVIWAFKQLYDDGLVYEGVKTLLYCTRCGTPVSNFEIAMDNSYEDMEDPAVTIGFELTNESKKKLGYPKEKSVKLLAWTTTPWTLPSNRALVIDPNEIYIEIKCRKAKSSYILAKRRLIDLLKGEKCQTLKEFEGKKLLGLCYEPLYTFVKGNKNDFKVYEYQGMVNMKEGTGIVHSAPGFGEIDTEMGNRYGLKIMLTTVDDEGKFTKVVKPWTGIYVKEADSQIIIDLKKRGNLVRDDKIVHRYPYCYRCRTPLIYKAVKAWFINIQKIKPNLLKQNKKINWVPSTFKYGRFKNTLETAPDWCISRTRYWATAMPIWECSNNHREVLGSISDIEKRSGKKVTDLHRTGLDKITLDCKECSEKMKRVPYVLDCWMESGSMPYGQIHYPFENKDVFKKTFPADYIVEYTGQLRAWFYYMHVISNALMNENSFKNVVVTGVMAGTDGRKMSKSYGNYPDPKKTLEKYGADALRMYLMTSPIMLGEDVIFDEVILKDQVKEVLFPLWNSYKYFTIYANIHSFKPLKNYSVFKPDNYIDKWMIICLQDLINKTQENYDKYLIPNAVRLIQPFLKDLTTWYIRRSRERFVKGDKSALNTLYYVLVEFCKLSAPIIPFITEKIYQSLVSSADKKATESVHLCFFPQAKELDTNKQILLQEMDLTRNIASLGQTARVESKIKVRQPLQELKVNTQIKGWMKDILKEELNVKSINFSKKISKRKDMIVKNLKDLKIGLNLKLTKELKQEGLFREFIRKIQDLRKKQGLKQGEKVALEIFTKDKEIINLVKEKSNEISNLTSVQMIINSQEIILGKSIRVEEKEINVKIVS